MANNSSMNSKNDDEKTGGLHARLGGSSHHHHHRKRSSPGRGEQGAVPLSASSSVASFATISSSSHHYHHHHHHQHHKYNPRASTSGSSAVRQQTPPTRLGLIMVVVLMLLIQSSMQDAFNVRNMLLNDAEPPSSQDDMEQEDEQHAVATDTSSIASPTDTKTPQIDVDSTTVNVTGLDQSRAGTKETSSDNATTNIDEAPKDVPTESLSSPTFEAENDPVAGAIIHAKVKEKPDTATPTNGGPEGETLAISHQLEGKIAEVGEMDEPAKTTIPMNPVEESSTVLAPTQLDRNSTKGTANVMEPNTRTSIMIAAKEHEEKIDPAAFGVTANITNDTERVGVANNQPNTTDTPPSLTSSSDSTPSTDHNPSHTASESLSVLEQRELQSRFNQSMAMKNAPPQTSLLPWSNLTTLTFKEGYLYSGFRNQMQVFTVLIMYAIQEGYGQILVESVSMKDLHGTNKQVPFQDLWDVEHWNSFYPWLPRLVLSDPVLHDQFNPQKRTPFPKTAEGNWTDIKGNIIHGDPTRPVYFGLQSKLMRGYFGYSKGKGPYAVEDGPNPVDLLIQSGALRPHKDLQALVDGKLWSMQKELQHHLVKAHPGNDTEISTDDASRIEYMALHARIEPDMQHHRVCRDRKVYNLTQIVSFLEETFPDPPAEALFLPINRKVLEKEGYPDEKHPENTNWIGVENLQALNDVLENGMWNGRVKVFQFGVTGLAGSKFENRSSITGAMLDYYIALNSKVFIGTSVSSFSHALMTTRFFRGEMENYEYLPDGVARWTPPGLEKPPGFDC